MMFEPEWISFKDFLIDDLALSILDWSFPRNGFGFFQIAVICLLISNVNIESTDAVFFFFKLFCSFRNAMIFYRVVCKFFTAIFVALCNSRVLFPIPGSPPTRTREPGTNPPPSTRSNSEYPLAIRSKSCSLSEAIGSDNFRNVLSEVAFLSLLRLLIEELRSSIIEFHSPQLEHLPKNCRVCAPQL